MFEKIRRSKKDSDVKKKSGGPKKSGIATKKIRRFPKDPDVIKKSPEDLSMEKIRMFPKKNPEVQKLPEFKPKRSRGTPRSGCSQKIRMFFKNPEVSKKSGCLKKIRMFPKAKTNPWKKSGCSQKKSGGPKTSGIQTKKIQRYPKIRMFPKDPDVF